MLPTAIRPFLAAILGPILIWAIAKFSQITGITYDAQTIQVINDGVILLVLVGVTKVFLNKKVNPANAASAGLAEEGKAEARQMKVTSEMSAGVEVKAGLDAIAVAQKRGLDSNERG